MRMIPSWHPRGILKIQDSRQKNRIVIFSTPNFEKVKTLKEQKIIFGISWTIFEGIAPLSNIHEKTKKSVNIIYSAVHIIQVLVNHMSYSGY